MNNFRNSGSTVEYDLPRSANYSRLITDGLGQPIIDGFRQAATNLIDSFRVYQSAAGTRRCTCAESKRDSCCSEPRNPCYCNCCIGDTDLVVYARLGERRVVPINIENRWRRDRHIKLELSDFKTRGGGTSPVLGQLEPTTTEFILPPCGHKEIILLIESNFFDKQQEDEHKALRDVDDCLVSYADLCVIGCDTRPIRMAVALLPRDCHPYILTCDCKCCC